MPRAPPLINATLPASLMRTLLSTTPYLSLRMMHVAQGVCPQDRRAEGPQARAAGASDRARAENRLADQPRALIALLRRLIAEREADVVLAALPRKERGTRRVLDARGHRELGELLEVRAVRKLDPEEEAAFGSGDGVIGAGQRLIEPAQHRVTLGAIDGDQPRDVRDQVVAHEIGRHARHVRVHAAAEEEALERRDHRLRRAEPADAHARAENLGARARAGRASAPVERLERRGRAALQRPLALCVGLSA